MLKKFSSSYWGHIWKWLFRNLFNPLSQLVNRVFLLLDQTESIQSGGVHSVWGVEGKKSEGLGKWIMSLKGKQSERRKGKKPSKFTKIPLTKKLNTDQMFNKPIPCSCFLEEIEGRGKGERFAMFKMIYAQTYIVLPLYSLFT